MRVRLLQPLFHRSLENSRESLWFVPSGTSGEVYSLGFRNQTKVVYVTWDEVFATAVNDRARKVAGASSSGDYPELLDCVPIEAVTAAGDDPLPLPINT